MSGSNSTESGYSGWANYATWGVALVLDNDEGTYTTVCERVEEIRSEAAESRQVEEGIWTIDQAVLFNLADWLKDFTEELCGLGADDLGIPEPTLMAQQVIGAGLADVDWDEIASHYIEEG